MHIKYKTIDQNQWERRQAFLGFKDFDFPNSVIGTEIDIAPSLDFWRAQKYSPYLSLVYAVCRSANAIPAFRQRIRGDEVVEHEVVHADFTVPATGDAFKIKLVEYSQNYQEFYHSASQVDTTFWGDPGDGTIENDHWIYMSSTPWFRFSHIVQPTDRRSGSIPRIAWGKFSPEGSKVKLPLSIQTHHALVDAIHVARFLDYLHELMSFPEKNF